MVAAAAACLMARPRSAVCGYNAAHRRVCTDRGRAREHACAANCGRQAQHWAYDHKDPNEHVEDVPVLGATPMFDRTVTLTYSLDSAHYLPLCAGCHAAFDQGRLRIQA